MSFKQINAFSPAAYITSIADDPGTPTLIGNGSNKSGTMEINMQHSSDSSGDAVWLDAREQLLISALISHDVSGTAGVVPMRFDPEFQLTDVPGEAFFAIPPTADAIRHFIMGQFNPDTGDQLVLASSQTPPTTVLRRLDIDTLVQDVGNHFTGGPNGDFRANTGSQTAGNEGYWTVAAFPGAWGFVFDGLKDGIPGETLNTGTNIYPQGLYLVNATACHLNGQAFTGEGWIWVDIWTRDAVGRLGGGLTTPFYPSAFPAEVNSSPLSITNNQSEAPIGNDQFFWGMRQYVPDGDATYTQPKGRLVFQSIEHIPDPLTAGDASDQRVYLRLTDFNPFGVAAAPGQPERVHGRIRATSRWNLDHDPHFGLSGQASVTSDPGSVKGMLFDPLRNRFVMGLRNNATAGTFADPYGVAEDTTIGFLSLEFDLASISAPTSLDVPRTGTIVEYITVLQGDIGEPITAKSVDWTLQRLSTEDEVLDASTFPGTSTVANGPIDTLHDGTAVLTIEADGTPLVETTDYTVVASTGVITWVTDQSGATLVTATYEHRATPASPPHGTLLTSSSSTDENGVARTSVFYPDNDDLVGTLDIIGVTES